MKGVAVEVPAVNELDLLALILGPGVAIGEWGK
jgi:hypothetical protein